MGDSFAAAMGGVKQGSCSFLKKRTKKLLRVWRVAWRADAGGLAATPFTA
jgi:hypothetical protein